MSAFLSGEMKDTVQMHPVGAYGLYLFLAIVFKFNFLCFQFWSVSFLVRNDKHCSAAGQAVPACG